MSAGHPHGHDQAGGVTRSPRRRTDSVRGDAPVSVEDNKRLVACAIAEVIKAETSTRSTSCTRRTSHRPPIGRAFHDVREVYWFTVRGDRIVEWWGLEDNDDRRRQLRATDRS